MKKVIIIIFMFLSIFVFQNQANALSCAELKPINEEEKLADVVFRGIVTGESTNKVKFEVKEVWKGELESNFKLNKDIWVPFEKGQEYIVFANKKDSGYSPRLCGNTGLVSSVNTDLLGESTKPKDGGMSSSLLIIIIFTSLTPVWIAASTNKKKKNKS